MAKLRMARRAFDPGPVPRRHVDGSWIGYTFQPRSILDGFVEGRAFKTAARQLEADFDEWPPDKVAYMWMADQVRERLGRDDFEFPVWVYLNTSKDHLIREAIRLSRREQPEVLIAARFKPSEVVVSDMLLWNDIYGNLNPVSVSEEESELFFGEHGQNLLTKEETVATWTRIFEPKLLERVGDKWLGPAHLQGCVAEIRADQVIGTWQLHPATNRRASISRLDRTLVRDLVV